MHINRFWRAQLSKEHGHFYQEIWTIKTSISFSFYFNLKKLIILQWTGEKFGSTGKTQKPAEIKQLQNETRSRFEGLDNIKTALKTYSKGLGK